MRVLLVGMTPSVHIARMAATLASSCEVGVFPTEDRPIHPSLTGVTVLLPATDTHHGERYDVRLERLPRSPSWLPRAVSLAQAIRRFRPDVISAQDVQHGGYLSAQATRLLRRPPPMMLNIWGSDLSLRVRVPRERRRILQTLKQVDLLMADCERDLHHARLLGFAGETAMAMPVAGGYELDALAALRAPGGTSSRRTIAVKGYQHFAGRAQVALHAIELCGTKLSGLHLAIHGVNSDEELLARRVAGLTGMELEVIARNNAPVAQEEVLRMHGRSRISLGLSIADGASASLLEAIVMGSLPIQSDTACVSEWIEDGVTGLVVPPEDPEAVAAALIRAVADDDLVDRAASLNLEVARERLDAELLSDRLRALYLRVGQGAIIRARDLPRRPSLDPPRP